MSKPLVGAKNVSLGWAAPRTLQIVIDLSQSFGVSSSGKTNIVAGANCYLGKSNLKLQLNAYYNVKGAAPIVDPAAPRTAVKTSSPNLKAATEGKYLHLELDCNPDSARPSASGTSNLICSDNVKGILSTVTVGVLAFVSTKVKLDLGALAMYVAVCDSGAGAAAPATGGGDLPSWASSLLDSSSSSHFSLTLPSFPLPQGTDNISARVHPSAGVLELIFDIGTPQGLSSTGKTNIICNLKTSLRCGIYIMCMMYTDKDSNGDSGIPNVTKNEDLNLVTVTENFCHFSEGPRLHFLLYLQGQARDAAKSKVIASAKGNGIHGATKTGFNLTVGFKGSVAPGMEAVAAELGGGGGASSAVGTGSKHARPAEDDEEEDDEDH